MQETHAKPYNLTTFGNVNTPFTPGTDCAGCDPDFDNVSDDEREIAFGLRDLNRMMGAA